MRSYSLQIRTVIALEGPVWCARAVELPSMGFGGTPEIAVADLADQIREDLRKSPPGESIMRSNLELLCRFLRGADKVATLSIKYQIPDGAGANHESSMVMTGDGVTL